MDFISKKIASKSELSAFGRLFRDAATQEQVNRYRRESVRHYDDYIIPGSIGDRFAAAEAGRKKAIEKQLSKGIGVNVEGRYIAGALDLQTALGRQLLGLMKQNKEE